MIFRPTILKRAYALAEGGTRASPSDVKRMLVAEDFSKIDVQD